MGGGLIGVVATLIVGSWGYLAVQTTRYWALRPVVDSLRAERVQVLSLAEKLARVEAEYENLRLLFGTREGTDSPDLWLPPTALKEVTVSPRGDRTSHRLPNLWPLTVPGFITQPLVPRGSGEHPGLDIAVATGSYIRAAGAGRVLRMGEDPLYGLFVVLEHDDGFRTVYGHASRIFVERGQEVRGSEVIALSGSTGQSTAPHLHFEVLLHGNPIDPLTMVTQPD
jgi:murein DD-endopeptidase MepM/ murein hydrolase activator NlpD